jgi:hypothetical protein
VDFSAVSYGPPEPPKPPVHPPFTSPELNWEKHGLEPRWLGRETSECAAAFNPSIFHNHGANERSRFLQGARLRGEPALIIATMGEDSASGDGAVRRSIFRFSASIHLGTDLHTSVAGAELPRGTKPGLADDLPEAERDLGLRLLSKPPKTWWELELGGVELERGSGGPPVRSMPQGTLLPILVDGLGAPLVAVWISPDEDQRVYVIPHETDPDTVLAWLVSQALPEYVPGALRRVRSPRLTSPGLQTTAETAARTALDDLKTRYATDLERLQSELSAVTAAAEPIRYDLLYGTGKALEKAVAAVLRAAGLTVTDLDAELGDTLSADLLATYRTERRMIEVKSESGNAPERSVGALERHMSTWPTLRPAEPVNGRGVLVVNHQHKLHPDDRSAVVYSRPEFVKSLKVVVLSSRQLFDWWAAADWGAIRSAVLGKTIASPSLPSPPPPAADPAGPTAEPQGWLRRSKRR